MPYPYDMQEQESQFAGDDLSGFNDPMTPPAGADSYSSALAQDGDITSGMRPETAEFLNDLAGIGTGAFLAMRQVDTPEYEDWRDENFTPDGEGNYVSREGQGYTGGELEQMHGVLSRQAGNPLVSGLFAGQSRMADYLAWRSQNYLNANEVGGGWEDEEGNLYTEPALQEMFGAKFATQSGDGDEPDPDSLHGADAIQRAPTQPEHGEGSKSNLAKRADIAKRALGYDASTHWAFDTNRSDEGFGPSTNKCNLFVYDLVKEAGAEARVTQRKKWPMPVAAEWSNPKFKIPNWRVLGSDESPQAGDVAAYPLTGHEPGEAPYTGHSGIIVADTNGKIGSISAHDSKVGPLSYDQFFHEDKDLQPTVVFRRYTGD